MPPGGLGSAGSRLKPAAARIGRPTRPAVIRECHASLEHGRSTTKADRLSDPGTRFSRLSSCAALAPFCAALQTLYNTRLTYEEITIERVSRAVRIGCRGGSLDGRDPQREDRSEERRVGKECRSRWSP